MKNASEESVRNESAALRSVWLPSGNSRPRLCENPGPQMRPAT
jgi:hypothetical protein